MGQEVGDTCEEVEDIGQEVGGVGQEVGEMYQEVGDTCEKMGDMGQEVGDMSQEVGGVGQEVGDKSLPSVLSDDSVKGTDPDLLHCLDLSEHQRVLYSSSSVTHSLSIIWRKNPDNVNRKYKISGL